MTRHDRSARLQATCSPSRSFFILYFCVPFGCGNLLPFILVVLVVGGDLVVGLLLEGVALDHVLNEVRLVNGVAKALLPTHYALIVQQAAGGQRSRLLHQQENQKERERERLHTTQREGIPKTSYHKYIKKTKEMEVNGLRLKALQHLAWQVYYSEKVSCILVIHGGVWDTWLRTGVSLLECSLQITS